MAGSWSDHAREEGRLRPRGRPKLVSDALKRSGIVEEARRIFVELGYAGTTTAIIAARCGVSKQTLYRLFASKEEIFSAVIVDDRRMMLDLPRPQGEDLPVAAALERIFMVDIKGELDSERLAFIHLLIREASHVPEIAEILRREGIDPTRQLLMTWLGEQVALGRMELADVESGARMLLDTMFGGIVPAPGESRAWPDRASLVRHLKQCIAIFARGVGAA